MLPAFLRLSARGVKLKQKVGSCSPGMEERAWAVSSQWVYCLSLARWKTSPRIGFTTMRVYLLDLAAFTEGNVCA